MAILFCFGFLITAQADNLPVSDADVEEILSNGTVVGKKPIGKGVTGASKLRLEWEGANRSAAFKTVDDHRTRLTRFKTASPELMFSDSYRYERAAYLLDRVLNINMMPVTVLRTVDGTDGAVIDWVEGAINELDRREKGLQAPVPEELIAQRNVMFLFDALVGNIDRNLGNQLITTNDWKLHVIDFSRSFRTNHKLTSAFKEIPSSLPRTLYEELKSMRPDTIHEIMKGLLSRVQVKALLARRKRLVEKIESDRNKFGDDFTFTGSRTSVSD